MENKTQSPANKKSTVENKQNNQDEATGGQPKEKTLRDLLEDGIKDIYSAEKQLVEALPKMAKAAYNEELEDAFKKHLEETKRQVERIEKVISRLNISTESSTKCAAMEGLIEECQKVIDNYSASPVRDSALIIGAQKIEHYEIASYGSLCELSDVLGYDNVCDLLDRTLQEEGKTDKSLTQLAQAINDEACEVA